MKTVLIIFCILVSCLFFLVFITYKYLKKKGYEPNQQLIFTKRSGFLSFFNKIQKDTGDNKLKFLIVSIYICYALLITLFVFAVIGL